MQRIRPQSILSLLMLSVMALPASAQLPTLPPELPMPGQAPNTAPALPTLPPAAPAAPVAPATPPNAPALVAPATPVAPAPVVVAPALPQLPAATAPSQASSTKGSISNVLSGMAQRSVNSTVEEGAAAAVAQPKVYSYGTSSLSVLFLPTQVERMKQAIRTYEDTAKNKTTTLVAPEPTSITAPEVAVNEPQTYPVFYLASIAYDTPGDWSLWISGHKITSRKNDTDLNVIRVTPDSATFSWAPSYMGAVNQRQIRDLFAPTDAVKNKLSSAQNVSIDEGAGGVTFTLKQNQSFSVGYFSTFEGFVEAPKMPAMTASSSSLQNSLSNALSGSPDAVNPNGGVPSANVPNGMPRTPEEAAAMAGRPMPPPPAQLQ